MRHPLLRAARLLFGVSVATAVSLGEAQATTVDPLCGTTITSDLTLTRDIDCLSHPGPAITIGADNVTLDGAGFRIIAPDASAAIYATNRANVTIENIDVSGWCMGIGIFLEGSTNATLTDIIADSRELGVHARGASGLTIQGLSSDGAGRAGLYLENLLSAPTLTSLSLTNARSGLRIHTSSAPFTINATTILSVAGSDYGIWLEDAVSNVTVTGLTLDTNPGAAIMANGANNANLTFTTLTLSGLGGGESIGGIGLHLVGANHLIDGITADDRQYGVFVESVTNLVARNITARRAGVAAFMGQTIGLSATNALTLENLVLTDSNSALRFNNVDGDPASPFQVDASVLTSTAGSRFGVYLENSTSYIDVRDLTLDNWGTAIFANQSNNSNLRFEDLVLSGLGPLGTLGENVGLDLSGSNHRVANVTADGRRSGVTARTVTNLVIDGISARDAGNALRIENTTLSATNSLAVANVACTRCTDALYLSNVVGQAASPWNIDAGVLVDAADSGRAVVIANASANFVVGGPSSAERWVLSNPVAAITTESTPPSNIRIQHVDASGPGQGTGIRVTGTNHVVFDVVANQRAIGLDASSTGNLRVEGFSAAWASNAGVALGSVTGTAPTLIGLSLTNSDRGLSLNGFNPPSTVTFDPAAITSLANSSVGIYTSGNVRNVLFKGLTLDNPTHAILVDGGTFTNVVFEDLILDGAGLGNGIFFIANTNAVVRNVRADRRATGMRVANPSNLVVEGFRSHHSAYGMNLSGFATGRVAPTFTGLDLQRNAVAIYVGANTGALTLGPANALDAASYLVTTGSTTSIELAGNPGLLTLRNLRLDGLKYGLDNSNAAASVVLQGIDASGNGIGRGFNVFASSASMTDCTANDRAFGLYVGAGNGTVLTNFVAQRCGVGVHVNGTNVAAVPPTLAGIDTRGSATGLSIRWAGLPWTLDQSTVALDASNTLYGIAVESSGGTTLDGFVLPSKIAGLITTGDAGVTGLTLRNLDVSGTGTGTGLELSRSSHTLENIVADNRTTGVRLDLATGGTITNLTSRHVVTGLRVSNSSGTLTLTDLHFEDAAPAVSFASYSGALALGPANFANLSGTWPAITTTNSSNVTVDAAGLGLTGPTSGAWYGTLPTSDPLCGTTLSGTTTLTADLDCSGTTGTAITLGAGATLDGDGFAILAPHATTVVLASGSGSSVLDLDVSGTRSTGTGVRVTTDTTVTNVTANRRAIGFDVDGASNATLTASTARHASGQALRLANLAGPTTLSALNLEHSSEGVQVVGSGANADPGGGDLVLDAASFASLEGNATSLRFNNASRFDVEGLTLDGYTHGILSVGSDLDFTALDVGASYPSGAGIELSGAAHVLTDITTTDRDIGLNVAASAPSLTVAGLVATRNTTGFRIHGTALGTAPPSLSGLDLRDNATGLTLSDATGPFTFTGTQFVMPVNQRRDNLVDVSVAGTTEEVTFDAFHLGGRERAFALSEASSACQITNLTAINDAAGGIAIELTGSTTAHTAQTVDIQGYAQGIWVDGASHSLSDAVIVGAGTSGLSLSGTDDHSVSGVTITDSGNAIVSYRSFMTFTGTGFATPGPGVVLIDALAGNETDVWLNGGTANTVHDLSLSGRSIGLRAVSVNTLVARDVTSNGMAPSGVGFSLSGPNHDLDRLSASQRVDGVVVQGASNAIIEDIVVDRASRFGIEVSSSTLTPTATLSMSALAATRSGTGLRFNQFNASAFPIDITPTLATLLHDNATDILATATRGMSFTGLTLTGATNGINASGGQNDGLAFTNLTLTPTRPGGTGLRIAGANNTISNVTADRRAVGLDVVAGATGTSISSLTSRSSDDGMTYFAAAPPIELVNVNVGDSFRGLSFNTTAGPWTMQADALTNLPSNAAHLTLTFTNSARDITLSGLVLNGRVLGLDLNQSTSGFTVSGVDASSTGTPFGTGLDISGTNQTFLDNVAHRRQIGMRVRTAASQVSIDGLAVSGAGVEALRVAAVSPTVSLSDLQLSHSRQALVLSGLVANALAPFVLDGSAVGPAPFVGNYNAVLIEGGAAHVTLQNLAIPSTNDAVVSDSSTTAIQLSNVDVSRGANTGDLHCASTNWGGNGVNMGGLRNRLEGVTALGRRVGLQLTQGQSILVQGGLIAANVTGVTVNGAAPLIDTTVNTHATNTATRFLLVSVANVTPTRFVRLDVGSGPEDREVLSVSGNFVTLSSPLSAVPTTGTAVRSVEFNEPRATFSSVDICANDTGVSSGALVVSATDNYWRTDLGPTHASNPTGTGDLVVGTATTLTPFAETPFDVVNPYCNGVPLPDAGDDVDACGGDTVTLDASSSTDPDGEPLTFAWSQLAGTAVSLATPTQAATTFVAPSPATAPTETLTFEVMVDDADAVRSDTVTITTHTRNTAPTAVATGPASADEATTVTLDGATSSDPEGEALTYLWVQTGGPSVTLSDADTAAPTFTAPLVGPTGDPGVFATLTFELTVTDAVAVDYCGVPLTGTDEVVITIDNVNNDPVAAAGDDQSVDQFAAVVLDGTGSNDPDGDTLTYSWTQVGGAAVTLTDADTATPGFTAPGVLSGSIVLSFEVLVDDGLGGTDIDLVEVTVNSTCIPTAEVCNGLDDDCDGDNDNGMDPIPAANTNGACSANVQICDGANGYVDSPTNASPTVETCNGIDDDCDTETDEGLGPISSSNTNGACSANVQICDGTNGYVASPSNYAPVAELCNNLDDNCDGNTDEDLVLTSEACVLDGGCAGVMDVICVDGQPLSSGVCALAEPIEDICNGEDDDCDGDTDEDFAPESISCGSGACGVGQGLTTCDAGVPGDTCDPLWQDIPDTTCGSGSTGINAFYLVVTDAAGAPIGSVRCYQDLDAPNTPVVCDTQPNSSELVVTPALLCEGVAP